MPLTDRQQEALAALEASGGNVTHAAAAMGVRRTSFQRLLTAARAADPAIEAAMEAVNTTLTPSGMWIKTGKDADGVSRSVYLRPQVEGDTPQDKAGALREAMESSPWPRNEITSPAVVGRKNLRNLVPIADGHWGMLAWGAESGHDYDLKIADELHRQALHDILARLPRTETGILLGLGDQLHANGIRPLTPASGHLLDVDSRFPKALRTVAEWFKNASLAMLDVHEKLIIKIMKGNHDEDTALAIELGLSMFFEHDDRVTVDMNDSYWWYHRFGENFIAAHHGHQIKPAQMPMHVADSRRHDWSAAHKHIIHGHFHTPGIVSVGSVPVECIPTVTAADAHSSPRYTNRRGMVGITYHEERGEHSRNSVWLTDGAIRNAA